MSSWHIYMIQTRHGTLYTGIATDVARRFAEHQSQGGRCAKYLRGRTPLKLVFKRCIGDRALALTVEQRIKRLPKLKKEIIIKNNPGIPQLIAQLGIEPDGRKGT